MKSSEGALVTAVDPKGPGAGTLIIGDVLLQVGSTPVSFKDLNKMTARLVPDALVTFTVMRAGKTESVALKIGRLPDPPADPTLGGGPDTWVQSLGIGVADTTSEIRQAIKASDEPNGVIVTQLRPRGPGGLSGLRVGDLITHLGTNPVFGVADITTVGKPTLLDPVMLRVVRDGAGTFIGLTGEAEP
jgi:serine protease Do